MLIALDGVDGAGKSLQCRLLAERLESVGKPCVVLREPGGTPLGERLRAALLEGAAQDALVEALLFMASRRHLVSERIVPELAAGKVVLLDRSFLSTWVYQGIVGGVELDFLVDLARRVHGEAWPDRILLLELSRRAAKTRRAQRLQERAPASNVSSPSAACADRPAEGSAKGPADGSAAGSARGAAKGSAESFADGTADAFEARGDEYLESIRRGYSRLGQRFSDFVSLISADGDIDEVHEACWNEVRGLLDG